MMTGHDRKIILEFALNYVVLIEIKLMKQKVWCHLPQPTTNHQQRPFSFIFGWINFSPVRFLGRGTMMCTLHVNSKALLIVLALGSRTAWPH